MNHRKMSSNFSSNSEENLILKFSLTADELDNKNSLKQKSDENEKSKNYH